MIIRLWDKTEFYVTKENGEKIKQAIEDGIDHIEVDGRWFRTSAIASILPGGYANSTNPQLPPASETDEDYKRAREKSDEVRKQLLDLQNKVE